MYCQIINNEKVSKYTKDHSLIKDLINKRIGYNKNDTYSHIAAFLPNLNENNLICYEGKDRYWTEL